MSKPGRRDVRIMDSAVITFTPAQVGQPKGTDVCMTIKDESGRYDIRVPLTLRDVAGLVEDLRKVNGWILNTALAQQQRAEKEMVQ